MNILLQVKYLALQFFYDIIYYVLTDITSLLIGQNILFSTNQSWF
jgi:hypothetical protein